MAERTYGTIKAKISSGDVTLETCKLDKSQVFTDYGSIDSLDVIHKETSRIIVKHGPTRHTPRTMNGILYAAIIVLFLTWFSISFFAPSCFLKGLNAEEYEYIVVGAGPAGLVAALNIAKRLQTEASYSSDSLPGKVLLLESGTKGQSAVMHVLNQHLKQTIRTARLTPNEFDIPLMWSSLSKKDNGDKGLSEFYSHHWPLEILGRAVGGSGTHNAMINVRALPNDFDRWNVTNFSAEDMMQNFDRLEHYDSSTPIPDLWKNNPPDISKRGRHGPLNTLVGDGVTSPVANDFLASSLAAGIPLASLGFNEPDASKRIGVGFYEFNIRNGLRDSAAKALLSPKNFNYEVPDNLVIRTDATVEKVLFNATTKNALGGDEELPKTAGVRYYSSKSRSFKEVWLRSASPEIQEPRNPEVILAAGALLSPQILANSGIHEDGPVADSKNVGTNLQDHPVIGVVFQTKKNVTESIASYFNLDKDTRKIFNSYVMEEKNYQSTGFVGAMSNDAKVYGTPGFAVGAFLRSPFSKDLDATFTSKGRTPDPDIQLTFFSHTIEPHFILRHNLTDVPKIRSILVTVTLLKPEMRYKLDLNDPTKTKHPSKTSGSLQTPRDQFEEMFKFQVPDMIGGMLTERDLKRLAWGVNQVRNIMTAPPLSYNIDGEQFPGDMYQNTELEQFIDRHVMKNSHWSGSTRMGNDDDKTSVVDSKLRVRGVSNLRIFDAGVMPFIPNGNTHSTTCAISLRGVDLIFGGGT